MIMMFELAQGLTRKWALNGLYYTLSVPLVHQEPVCMIRHQRRDLVIRYISEQCAEPNRVSHSGYFLQPDWQVNT